MAEEIGGVFPQTIIDDEQKRAGEIKQNPRSIIPPLAGWGQRPNPEARDMLLSALMGLPAASQAAMQGAQTGDPLAAALAAIAGGAGAVAQNNPQAIANARAMQQRQLEMAALEATPVDQLAPGLIAKYPEFQGLPISIVQKLAPFIQRSDALEQKMALFMTAEKGRSERAATAANKPAALGAEAAVKISLAQDGRSNIDDIRAALSGPDARALILKAGGSWKKLTTLNDPKAEALANAIFQVADAEARIKTGAAINTQEVEQYFNSLVPKTGTLEGINDRLARKQRYFESIEGGLSYGRKTPPRASGGAATATSTADSGGVMMVSPSGKLGRVAADKVAVAETKGFRRVR